MTLDSTVIAAAAAFPAALRASNPERASWLRAIADALDANTDELVAIAHRETHLPEPRLVGEVARTSGQLRLFAEVIEEGSYVEATIDHANPRSSPPQPDLRRMLRPIGPVAVFSASNFPFAFSVVGGDTASALAVGCPVVVKAHPGHPELSRRVASIATAALGAAGAPVGLLGLVEGFEAGIELVRHPAMTAVAFTGSLAGGRALHELAATRPAPIPFYGELGSINPVVVTAAADATRGEALAAGLSASFTLGSGQFCTKPGVVFVPEHSQLARSLTVPDAVGPLLTDSIQAAFDAGVARLRSIPGVELVTGGEGRPTVLSVASDALARRADELLAEVFGPVTLLVTYRDAAELLPALDDLEGSLTATLHAEPGDEITSIIDRLEAIAGRVLFAGWPTGVAVSWAQQHGGPWPATTSIFTSVGATAVRRFLRPIAYQDAPASALPLALRDDNPLGVPQRVDGKLRASSHDTQHP